MKVDRDVTVVKPAWTLEDLETIGQPVVVDSADTPVGVVICEETNRRLKSSESFAGRQRS